MSPNDGFTAEDFLRAQSGDTAIRDRIVVANMGLSHSQAIKLARFLQCEKDDLAQTGMLALIRAVRYFRPDTGLKFSTYAVHVIRKQMLTSACKERLVRVPRPLGKDSERVRAARSARTVHASQDLDASLSLQGLTQSGDGPAGEAAENEAARVAELQRHLLPDWIETLDQRCRNVIRMRYLKGMKLKDVAEYAEKLNGQIGMTRGACRDIEQSALAHLRKLARKSGYHSAV